MYKKNELTALDRPLLLALSLLDVRSENVHTLTHQLRQQQCEPITRYRDVMASDLSTISGTKKSHTKIAKIFILHHTTVTR